MCTTPAPPRESIAVKGGTQAWKDANLFESLFLTNASKTEEGDRKDSMDPTFEYLILGMERPWLATSLLRATNWFIPGKKKGELTAGGEATQYGVLNAIPDKAILIRKLVIRASFTDNDQRAFADSFAVGPFRVTQDAAIREGELSIPGIQIIAYIDRSPPPLPPRSDPSSVL